MQNPEHDCAAKIKRKMHAVALLLSQTELST
jgi:hypothetical protein